MDDSDTHDQIELAYFPNVTPFGGPTLQPAVFGGAVGSPFDNFAANFGPSSDLGDNGPGQLREWPLGRRLRVLLVHDACAQRLTTRLFDAASGEEVDAGLAPVDLRFLNATATFTVDAFAISLYRDHADFDPSTRSLFADVRFHSAEVEIGGAPAAELRPASLNPGARGGAVLRLSGGVFRWSGADRAEIVTGSGERLEVALRREGAALAARLERSVAADGPLEVAVGGCTLAVPEPRLVPGR